LAITSSRPSQKRRERKKPIAKKPRVHPGAYAINPINGEKIPVWVADYVLYGYGHGAIMARAGA